MNPFALPTVPLLGLYLGVGAVLGATLWAKRRWDERGEPPTLDPFDPYLVAGLRAGRTEVIRVATLALLDRGLLQVHQDTAIGVRRQAAKNTGNALDQALIAEYQRPTHAHAMTEQPLIVAQAEVYAKKLAQLGLRPSETWPPERSRPFAIALTVLWGTGIAALIARGWQHTLTLSLCLGIVGIGFFMAIALMEIMTPDRTVMGDAVLRQLQTQQTPLKLRLIQATTPPSTDEVLQVAAVFGVDALPADRCPYLPIALAVGTPPKTDAKTAASGSGDGLGGVFSLIATVGEIAIDVVGDSSL